MMPNVLQYPVAIAAILRAGYIVVNVNPLYTPRELEHQLKDRGAEAIIMLENFAATLQAVRAQYARSSTSSSRRWATCWALKGAARQLRRAQGEEDGAGLDAAAATSASTRRSRKARAHDASSAVTARPDDVAFLQYTGGTTGVAKGATLLHRNVIANVLQSEAWLEPAREAQPDIDQFVTVCRAAAVSHLRADGLRAADDPHGRRSAC